MNRKIFGFIHVAQMGNWREVLSHQISLIERTRLANICQEIYIGLLGLEKIKLSSPFKILYQSENLLYYEYETLRRVRDFSQNNNALVWYIHTKGVSKNEKEWEKNKKFYKDVLNIGSLKTLQNNEKEWRLYMEHFIIKKHKICIDKLKTNDLVGVSWREQPCPHFSGNFWWSKTNYLKTLADPYSFGNMVDVFGDYRGGAECWVGSGKPSIISLHNLNYNFYRWGVPIKDYLPLHN